MDEPIEGAVPEPVPVEEQPPAEPPQPAPDPPIEPGVHPLLAPFGITPQHMVNWKAQYGKIALITIDEFFALVRPISRKEWRELMSAGQTDADAMKGDERIFRLVTLVSSVDSNHLSPVPFGLIAGTVQKALELSGLKDAEMIEL